MVEIEIQYEGHLHTHSVHRPSGAELQTDAPVDNQGRGEAFSPTDLVASALGACMLTVMGILADRHGWSIAGTRIRVEKLNRKGRRFGPFGGCGPPQPFFSSLPSTSALIFIWPPASLWSPSGRPP